MEVLRTEVVSTSAAAFTATSTSLDVPPATETMTFPVAKTQRQAEVSGRGRGERANMDQLRWIEYSVNHLVFSGNEYDSRNEVSLLDGIDPLSIDE